MASTCKASRSKSTKRARFLKLSLQNLRHYYNEPVSDYLARAKTMADCLAAIVDDPVDLVVCVISGLRSDFWELHNTLMARAEPPVTFSDLYSILVAHEETLQKNNAKTSSPRLTARQRESVDRRLRKAAVSLCLLHSSPRGNQSNGGHNGNGIKRTRDDTYNYQLKRPFGSTREESSDPAQARAGGTGGGCSSAQQQKATIIDALKYLNIVKYTFEDKQEKLDMFTYVLGKFKEQRIDTAFVVASVKLLFKGHNDLIVGLNTFLPKGSEIIITEDDEASAKRTTTEFKDAKTFLSPFGAARGESSGQQQSPGGGGCSSAQKKQELTAIDALTYLIKVHDTFPKNKEKYHIFLDLMKDFKDKRIDTAGVLQRVKDLFKRHNDLLIGFSAFLSDDINIDVPKI